MVLSRRDFFRTGTGAVAGLLTGMASSGFARAADKKKIPVGLELWSVRDSCQKDLPGVLRAVAEMGYDGIEFAHSYYGHDAESLRKLLDETGLKSCGMHTTVPHLQGDALKEMIRVHTLLGTPYLIVASLPRKRMHSRQALLDTAKWFNDLSEQLKPHGMKIGYHCHAGDFVSVDGSTPWEILGEHTNADVILQLDVGNCLSGGGDPYTLLKKFPGRTLSIHLKEHGGPAGAVFGEGKVKWNEVFRLCETVGGTRWYIIEEESRKGPAALAAVRRALKNFRKMGK